MSYFGQPKMAKREKPDSTPYTLHYPHSIDPNHRASCEFWRIVSIDPGRINFALRIEDRFPNGAVRMVAFEKIAIKEVVPVENTTLCSTYKNLTNFLEKFVQHYPWCREIYIERQLPSNYQAVRISQHVISYFSIKLYNTPLLPEIFEIAPTLKSKALKKPKNEDLKKWAVVKAVEYFNFSGDFASLEILAREKKKDDLSDTKIQIEAVLLDRASRR